MNCYMKTYTMTTVNLSKARRGSHLVTKCEHGINRIMILLLILDYLANCHLSSIIWHCTYRIYTYIIYYFQIKQL